MTTFEKIILFFSSFGGVGAATRIIDKINKRQIKSRNILIDNINYWKNSYDSIKKEKDDLLMINNLLKIELSSIYNKRESVPIPMWEKDKFGRMVWCNEVYENSFLKPIGKTRAGFYGLTDVEFLGEMAKNWSDNDLLVIENKKGWFGVETMKSGESDLLENWKIFKDIILTDGVVTGTIGVAMKID